MYPICSRKNTWRTFSFCAGSTTLPSDHLNSFNKKNNDFMWVRLIRFMLVVIKTMFSRFTLPCSDSQKILSDGHYRVKIPMLRLNLYVGYGILGRQLSLSRWMKDLCFVLLNFPCQMKAIWILKSLLNDVRTDPTKNRGKKLTSLMVCCQLQHVDVVLLSQFGSIAFSSQHASFLM